MIWSVTGTKFDTGRSVFVGAVVGAWALPASARPHKRAVIQRNSLFGHLIALLPLVLELSTIAGNSDAEYMPAVRPATIDAVESRINKKIRRAPWAIDSFQNHGFPLLALRSGWPFSSYHASPPPKMSG